MTMTNDNHQVSGTEALSATAGDIVELGTGRAVAVIFAALLGLFIVFGAGLAQPDILHNAAHDSRHSFSFPCH